MCKEQDRHSPRSPQGERLVHMGIDAARNPHNERSRTGWKTRGYRKPLQREVSYRVDNAGIQKAPPTRGLERMGYQEVRRVTQVTKIGMQRLTGETAARFPSIKEEMEAKEVTKVRCLGDHMCDRNQPLTEETGGHRRGHNGSDRRRIHG
ncbi:hypothetical protein PoB_006260500 [Plakobranchus ocellatus]|uniref:Uncharacterized protein n=1 Tax=Plakobranchus ocellatus TaxID=259542 RepID=A0AAV4CW53_9GAST|nr:hypothetical protein PoB_006260500 [Plakobranchus ocellatus]